MKTFKKIINSDRNKIFKIMADYENFQKKHSSYFPSVKIISVRGNVSVVEEHVRISSFELIMLVKHVIEEPILHEIFVLGGDAKGTHIICRFEIVPKGTLIIYEINLKLSLKLKLMFFLKRINFFCEYFKIMDDLVKSAD
jgi:hypothetical protein